MIQHQIPHPPGTLKSCCAREPQHIECRGRTRDEAVAKPIDFDTPAIRHVIACGTCGRSTGRHASLDDAIVEWGALEQTALPLRVVTRRRSAA